MGAEVLGSRPPPGVVRLRPAEPFVGRGPELERLQRALDLDQGRGALVEGEAGIGKSRLVTEALRRVAPGRPHLTGRGDPLQRHRPFGAIAAAVEPDPRLDGPERRLAGLLQTTTTGRAAGPFERGRIVDGFVDVVHDRCSRRPRVLVVEDLQWADPGSLAVLGELLELDAAPALSVLLTLRGRPRSRALDTLLERIVPRRLEHLLLTGLAPDEVDTLVVGVLGASLGVGLQGHVRRAGGNPLFVLELLRALNEQGSLTVDHDVVEVTDATLPPPLRLTLLQRLSVLSPDGVETLRIAALLGTTFSLEDLACALDLPPLDVVARLEEPLRAGWVQEAGARMAFRHDLVREALVSDLPTAARRAWHRQIAARLTAAGRPATDVAVHLVAGATAPDPEAVAMLSEAGRSALVREPAAAVSWLTAATRLEPDGPGRDDLRLRLGVALLWAGRYADGEQVLTDLLEGPHDPAVDVEAVLTLARTWILSGRTRAAIDLLGEQRQRRLTPTELPSLEATRALAALLRGDLGTAEAAVAAVLDGGTRPDDEARCMATWIDGSLQAIGGRVAAGIDRARQAVALARVSADRETARIPPQLALGSMLIDADEFEEGRRELAAAAAVSEDLGTVWHLPVQQLFAARGSYLAGSLDDAAAEAETALRLAEDHDVSVLAVWAHAILALVHLHRLDHEGARAALADGDAAVAVHGPQVRGMDWLLWARSRLDAAEGDPASARALLEAVWSAQRELGVRSERRLLGPDLVRLHLDAGDRASVEQVVDDLDEAARLMRTRSSRAAALHARGLLRGDAELLLAAAEATRGTPCVIAHVDHCLDAAATLDPTARDVAVPLAREARRLAAQRELGDRRHRADALLRALGVRAGARGSRARPTTGWAALTPTERTVAALAARGMSNPEIGQRLFVSRRTVQTHLSNTYRKLGIGSRVELAAEVARGERR